MPSAGYGWKQRMQTNTVRANGNEHPLGATEKNAHTPKKNRLATGR